MCTTQDGKSLGVTVLTNSHGLLTKEFSLGEDGAISKGTNAYLADGSAQTVHCRDLEAFGELLQGLKHSQCLAYGTTGMPSAQIVTKDKLHLHPGKIARDRQHFQFRKGPGIWLNDHDHGYLPDAYDAEALREAVVRSCPELADAPMLWWPSASSFIFDKDTGAEIHGLRGQRLYTPVLDTSDIPRAGATLYELLWAAGIGCFAVSKSGQLLDRNLVDSSVWQPEREDFAAGAFCHAPLEQRRPPPRFWESELLGGFDPFDTRAVRDLTSAQKEAAAAHRNAARAAVDEKRQAVREAYLGHRAEELANLRGLSIERARQVVTEAMDRQLLFADFVLYPEAGNPASITVGEILDNPGKWHGRRFADPLEPDYDGKRRIAWANLRSGGRPYLHSHAHGGRRYGLLRQPATLQVQSGEIPRLADECLRIINVHGEVFDFGNQTLVRVANSRIYPVTPAWMADYLGRVIRFERFDARGKDWKPIDTPDKVAKAVVERAGERGLPRLKAIVTAPTMRPDGSVLDAPGYDEGSGLLYLSDHPDPARVPTAPSREAVRAALAELWQPFAAFPFADAESRGVMLAALLSAVVRRSLPTCPAFGFDAPAAGTGKTLLARCVSALGGSDGASFTPLASDDELRKMLFSALRDGAGCVLIDNQVQPVGGAAINQFITEPLYAGRILGVSMNDAIPNAALLLLTGNNLRTLADTCRRVLTCRVDSNVERPYLRRFEFDPLEWVRARRQRLVVAAPTLLRGYQAAGAPAVAAGRLASFEAWDSLVRQAVCWLASEQNTIEFADPALTIERNVADDQHKTTLVEVLRAWQGLFGAAEATAADALRSAHDVDLVGEDVKNSARMALRDALDAYAVKENATNAVPKDFYTERRGKGVNETMILQQWQTLKAVPGDFRKAMEAKGASDSEIATAWALKGRK